MSKIISKILELELSKKHVIFFYRYVDDIIAAFNGTDRQLNLFLKTINNIHPAITLEKEKDKQINFLDLTLNRTNNIINIDIYRKPTFTDCTIPSDSMHPNCHKHAAYNSMVYRCKNLPLSKENYEKEINTIKVIASNNGYSQNMINNIINKFEKKETLSLLYSVKNLKSTPYICLTYYGLITDRISKMFKKLNINVSFRSSNKTSSLLFNAKEKLDPLKKSGVYQLKCNDCEGTYVGQTGRSFKKRIDEHLRSAKYKKTDSSFANHLIENNHSYKNNYKILHLCEKGRKLNLLEAAEIFKLSKNPNLLNDQTDIMYSPLFNSIK